MHTTTGKFAISLDFELYWGVRDERTLDSYRDILIGARAAIPRLLELFRAYEIHATWATVGFLFCENQKQLIAKAPRLQPSYQNKNLSPYGLATESEIPLNDYPFHFASSLIEEIKKTPHQEIGTHTFCHYYCLETGQTKEQFAADLAAAIHIAEERGIETYSLVFPRNQYNEDYLSVLRQLGVLCYRGNQEFSACSPTTQGRDSSMRRLFRLLDAYINLSGNNGFSIESVGSIPPYNIRASRFFRAYFPKLGLLEPLKLIRMKHEMTDAARRGLIYHLWWHPHNLGNHQERSFATLEKLCKHYRQLQQLYNFESKNMSEIALEIAKSDSRTKFNLV